MVLVDPFGYPLRDSIDMFLGLALFNYFEALEVALVGVLIGAMFVLMIGTGERSLVDSSLGLPIVSPPESPNHGDVLPGTLLGNPLGLCIVSESVSYWCYYRRFVDFHEAVFWEVGISCSPSYGTLITSNMNSVRYFQLFYFLTLNLSPTWLIPYSGGR